MNREEKLESLKLYLESIDRLPEDALRHGVSLYELRTIFQIVYELLSDS
jgi:hypothetical protein